MKTRVWNYLLPLFLISGIAAIAQQQDDASVPGDNFSLEGALDLFKKSASPEEFEKMLNSSNSKVNNLDLNGDGEIDYIRVIDKNEGNVHAFILQSVISKNESQDVAVIELEKLGDGKARLQIIGDEDVYGQETIIEPTQDVRVNAGTSTARTTVNVWAWPSVQYVYAPYYNPWVSPWSWAYYPGWWNPWSPVAYAVYNPWWTPYRAYYSPCYSYRIGYAQRMYRPYRTTSVIVYNRHSNQINHYRSQHGSNNNYSHNGRNRSDRGYADSNSSRHSGNDSRANYNNNNNDRNNNDRNNNRSSWSGGDNSRSSWRSSNDNNRTNNNGGGRTSNNFSNDSRDNNSNLSNQQRSSWGDRTNSGSSTNSRSNNSNWQRPSGSGGSGTGRGSSSGFSRPQGGGGGSFQRSSSPGGSSGGGATHSGGNSRGRH